MAAGCLILSHHAQIMHAMQPCGTCADKLLMLRWLQCMCRWPTSLASLARSGMLQVSLQLLPRHHACKHVVVISTPVFLVWVLFQLRDLCHALRASRLRGRCSAVACCCTRCLDPQSALLQHCCRHCEHTADLLLLVLLLQAPPSRCCSLLCLLLRSSARRPPRTPAWRSSRSAGAQQPT